MTSVFNKRNTSQNEANFSPYPNDYGSYPFILQLSYVLASKLTIKSVSYKALYSVVRPWGSWYIMASRKRL